jgi:hypothetical protein
VLLAEIYCEITKSSKSLEIINVLLCSYSNDPYLLYYQGKYLFSLSLIDKCIIILDSIVQYNQYEVWILLSRAHLQLKNFSDCLVCLNHASKWSKMKTIKGF